MQFWQIAQPLNTPTHPKRHVQSRELADTHIHTHKAHIYNCMYINMNTEIYVYMDTYINIALCRMIMCDFVRASVRVRVRVHIC